MCLAVPGQVLEVTGEASHLRQGRVRFGGIEKQVNLAFVPEAAVGDFVLVHVGFAISVIDATEAARIFTYLEEVDEVPR